MEIKTNNQDVCECVARVLIYFYAKNNNWTLPNSEKEFLSAIICSFFNITNSSYCSYPIKLEDWSDGRLSEDGDGEFLLNARIVGG